MRNNESRRNKERTYFQLDYVTFMRLHFQLSSRLCTLQWCNCFIVRLIVGVLNSHGLYCTRISIHKLAYNSSDSHRNNINITTTAALTEPSLIHYNTARKKNLPYVYSTSHLQRHRRVQDIPYVFIYIYSTLLSISVSAV